MKFMLMCFPHMLINNIRSLLKISHLLIKKLTRKVVAVLNSQELIFFGIFFLYLLVIMYRIKITKSLLLVNIFFTAIN